MSAVLEHVLNDKRAFRSRLLRWYDSNQRDLPWRRTKVPYRIWVSEIMLQQTRVNAVKAYYLRFLREFPTVKALAQASEDQVLTAWSGLGYYRRARMMHAAAQRIQAEMNGKLPSSAAELQELPGIGRYTAAAVASIAFNEPKAVVDGNVERVAMRLAGKANISSIVLWEVMEELVSRARPGDFNQAMMELGATVCAPVKPECPGCPVKQWCKSKGAHRIPPKAKRRQAALHYALSSKAGKINLVQRSSSEKLMAGMWELPLLSEPSGARLLDLRHSITTTDYRISVYAVEKTAGKCVGKAEMQRLPLTGLTKKILKRLNMFGIEP